MRRLLGEAFPRANVVEAHNDLLGAARALSGHNYGIASILGTGANSCYYDGETIIQNTPALGYILGDEGSGAWFGRQLLGDYLKGQMSERARQAFEDDFGVITPESGIKHVYQMPCPNRYLATFAAFLGRHLSLGYVEDLAYRGTDEFWRRNVMRIADVDGGEDVVDVRLVGSLAWELRSIVLKVAESHGYVVTQVIKDPIEGLI